MSWFEEWFDSPLYEKIYSNRNKEEAALLANLIETIIPIEKYSNILDLGCGRGRHSITLAQRGYQVTGLDLSEEAIHKARRLAENEGLANLQFFIGDMRDQLDYTFDAVLNLFTTFGYFLDDSENIKVLFNVKNMIKNDGIFIQDFLNSSYIKKTLVPHETGRYENLYYEIERRIENGMVFKNIRFTGPDLTEPVEYNERVKLYNLTWFKEQLSNTGLKLQATYGEYDGRSYDEQESSRMIMVSKKSE